MATLANTTTRDISGILRTSQQKAFSTGIFTFGLIAVLLWGSLRPTISTIFETSEKFQTKQALLKQLENQNTTLTKLIADKESLKDDLKKLDTYFPSDGNYALFIANLNLIFTKYNYTLQSVNFSNTITRQLETNPNYAFEQMSPVTFQFAIRGNPSNIVALTSYIEGTPYVPKILSVSYTYNKTKPDDTDIVVSLLVYKLSAPIINE
jgi:hypothetical protein